MKFRDLITQELTGVPDDTATTIRLELAKLGTLDRELDSFTVKEIRQVASVLNIPIEDAVVPFVCRRCRVCGCTDENCQACVERTGSPCYWIAEDLCSACEPAEKGGPLR